MHTSKFSISKCFLTILFVFSSSLIVSAQSATERKSIQLISADYAEPTNIYGHRVIGDIPNRSRIIATLSDGGTVSLDLPQSGSDARVFEDIEPHIADINQDGLNDIIVVESALNAGASVAVYELSLDDSALALSKMAQTPYIGQPNRWLAMIGAADFDDDGNMDLAYVETPHLGKALVIQSFIDGELVEKARVTSFSNHRIGDETIQSEIVECENAFGHNSLPTIVLPDGQWREWIAVQWVNQVPSFISYAAYTGDLGADLSTQAQQWLCQ